MVMIFMDFIWFFTIYPDVQVITPPARRAWRSYKFATPINFFGVQSWATAHG